MGPRSGKMPEDCLSSTKWLKDTVSGGRGCTSCSPLFPVEDCWTDTGPGAPGQRIHASGPPCWEPAPLGHTLHLSSLFGAREVTEWETCLQQDEKSLFPSCKYMF